MKACTTSRNDAPFILIIYATEMLERPASKIAKNYITCQLKPIVLEASPPP